MLHFPRPVIRLGSGVALAVALGDGVGLDQALSDALRELNAR